MGLWMNFLRAHRVFWGAAVWNFRYFRTAPRSLGIACRWRSFAPAEDRATSSTEVSVFKRELKVVLRNRSKRKAQNLSPGLFVAFLKKERVHRRA
jgi:hypothetical protein